MTSNSKIQTDYLFYSKRKVEGKLKILGLAILGIGILGILVFLMMGDTIMAVSILTVPLVGAMIASMTVTIAVRPDKVVVSFWGVIRNTIRIEDIAYAQSSNTDKYDSFSRLMYGHSIVGKGSYAYNVGYPFVIVAKRNGDLGYIKASVNEPEKCVAVITDLVDKYVEGIRAGKAS